MMPIQDQSYILRELLALSVKQGERQRIFNNQIFKELVETKEIINTVKPLVLDERFSALEARENLFEFRLSYLQKLLKDF
jgi:ABC-type hemin transport system ATPase subunit